MAEYKYGDPVIINGKNVGTAAFDSATGKPLSQTNLQTGGETSDFMKAIQDKLLGQSTMISSTNSDLQTKLESAISGVKESVSYGNAALESQFQRELGYSMDTFGENMVAGRAAGSGGIMNMAALRSLTETTDKSLKDLAMRKEELILQNNAAGAAKIAEMEFAALEFKQKAEQQVFANLLSIASFGLQAEEFKQKAQAQSFAEKSAISSIALQYGIPVSENDTIETIVAKASPFASEVQKANLAKIIADTKYTQAQTQKALAGDSNVSINSGTLSGMAIAAYNLTKDPAFNTPGSQAYSQFQNLVATATKGGTDALASFTEQLQKHQQEEIEQKIGNTLTTINPNIKTTSSGGGLGGIIKDFFNPPTNKPFTTTQKSAGLYFDPLTGQVKSYAK